METVHAQAREGSDPERLTVVVPVYNEGANLPAWWAATSSHLPPGARVLLVHDFPEDDTLPVARALAAEGAPLVPLRSRGRGFAEALLTGLLAVAEGPVLVTMADLSDDLGCLHAMLAARRGGAEIVVGSRLMEGGRMEGAHPFKRFLTRAASGSLVRLARFPVHDASNAFRLYDGRLIHRLPLPRTVGFDVSLSLLVTAWIAGARIAEVPATWRSRTRGVSRFRWAWLPRYARLWGRALWHGVRAGPVR